ncbi:reverse transcriptase domain-containing protein, partial [Tanacetum coccineum]
ISRDVFILVVKFTFSADFVIVDYESDPRVPFILGRPFLRTARALIDVHGEKMILRDGNERLILNMRNDTSSYSTQTHQESINMIDVYNVSHEEILKDLFATNHPSGNPTPISEPVTKSSSSSPALTSIEESELIWEEFEAYLASDSFPSGNSNPSSPLPLFHNSLSGSTPSSSPSLSISETSDYFLEEFADELALITFLSGNDDLPFDAESDLQEIEYFLNHDPIKEINTILEDSVDENSLDDNLEEKIKDSKILIDELDPPRSSDFLPFPGCDSAFYENFFEVDALSLTNNEDKVFNPGILIHENLFEVTNLATTDKNVKKISYASLILENFSPSLYELPFHKEVPGLGALLSFSSENKEKVFNLGILTSKRVHTSLLRNYLIGALKLSKSLKFLKARWRFFLSLMERTSVFWMFRVSISIPLDKLKISRIFEASRALGFCPSFTRASHPQLHFGNPISKSYRLTFIFKHT